MNHTSYTPEMGQKRPADTQIDASIGHYGGWFLHTPLTLKGRGITFRGTTEASTLVPAAQHKAGWNNYKVTDLAFEKLSREYRISMESLLS